MILVVKKNVWMALSDLARKPIVDKGYQIQFKEENQLKEAEKK